MRKQLTRRGFVAAAGGIVAAGMAGHAALGQVAGAAGPAGPTRTVKILGIATSLRKGKTTTAAVQAALDAAKTVATNIEVELIDLAGMKLPAEPAAGLPLEPGQTDDFPKLAEKLSDPTVGGLIVGTPVYMGDMSSLCKIFLERLVAIRKSWPLRDKVAGVLAVGAGKSGGQDTTALTVIAGLMRQDMIFVGTGKPSAHPGAALQNQKDSIAEDESGLSAARGLGKRVAEVALNLAR